MIGNRSRRENPSPSGYYFRLAGYFRIGKYLSALVFALFMIMMLFVYGDKITYNNFRYMLKDIDAAALLRTDATFETVNYKTTDPSFASLNGNLVVADSGTVSLYNPAGIEVYSIPFDGQRTEMVTDGKYLLVYDMGDRAFLLSNSITQLVSDQAEGSLYAADVSPSGAFALAMSAQSTRYEIKVYNSSFSHSATYGFNDYVMGVSLSEDGKELAIVTLTGTGDVPDTTLRIGAVGEESYRVMETAEGEFPVRIDWSGDRILLETDVAAYFYSADGTLLARRPIGGRAMVASCLSDAAYAVATSKNGETLLTVFDRSGNVRYNEKTSDRVRDLAFCENGLLILSVDRALYLSLDGFLLRETAVDDALDLLGVGNYGLVCGKHSANAIFVK